MRFVLPALLALIAGCVCGYDHSGGDDDAQCPSPELFQPAASVQGRVYVQDVEDGQVVPIEYGPQGGCMLTPTICVEAPWIAEPVEQTCMIVGIENAVPQGGAYVDPGGAHMTALDRAGDGLYCAVVWNYLDQCESSHDGLELRMKLEVRDVDGQVARGETAVLLQD